MHEHNEAVLQKRFILSLALTVLVFFAELIGGFWTGSLSLLSDAAHVFLDAFALGMSFLAMRLAALPADERHTFGYHRWRVLVALINGASLLFVAGEIFRESWNRLSNPAPVLAGPMLVVAVVGLAANLIVALVLRQHDHHDLNVRSAFLHVLGDALASVGVIAAGTVIAFTGWTLIDPIVSALIGIIILLGSGRLVLQSLHILAQGMPEGLTASEVSRAMSEVEGVEHVHDLHVWTVSPGYLTLSAHVLLNDQALSQTQSIMDGLKAVLVRRFGIEHTTIQFECAGCDQDCLVCRQDS
jgi:cobalt-zinc-cadmium efflux system protein